MKTICRLYCDGSYAQKESAISAAISQLSSICKPAVILEGLPSGELSLSEFQSLLIQRVAPGCFCCIGNLVLTVTLNRLLKHKPSHLFIAIQSAEHLDNLQAILTSPRYSALLSLNCL